MIVNVGEIYALRGDFVIDQIWGAISVSRGAISADKNILKFWIDSKNKNYICHFGTDSFDALSTSCFVEKIIKHDCRVAECVL